MDRNKAIELSKIYSTIVKNVYNPYKVVLYGSYCRNEQTKDSDIDIAVIFNGFSGDWLKTSGDLVYRKGRYDYRTCVTGYTKRPQRFCAGGFKNRNRIVAINRGAEAVVSGRQKYVY